MDGRVPSIFGVMALGAALATWMNWSSFSVSGLFNSNPGLSSDTVQNRTVENSNGVSQSVFGTGEPANAQTASPTPSPDVTQNQQDNQQQPVTGLW